MKNLNSTPKKPSPGRPGEGSFFARSAAKFALLGSVAAASALTGSVASAQSVSIRSVPQRLTVADVSTNVNVFTNYVVLSASPGTENLTLFGLPSAYASYGFTVSSGSASFGTLLTINTMNVPEGEYPLDVNASGGVVGGDGYLTLQSGRMWTGSTNVSTVWSSSGSWIGGGVPGASDDVLFTQLGAQTNSIVNSNLFFNSEVDRSFTIKSLRFSQTNASAGFHTIQIDPGSTLKITGPLGLRFLPDYITLGLAKCTNTFTGGSGTLFVTNESANIADLYDAGTAPHGVDLSGLGTFVTDVNRIGLGDLTLYPYDYNIAMTNGYSTSGTFLKPTKCLPYWSLARTNYLRAVYVDPNNYDNATNRFYSLTLVKGDSSASGSSLLAGILLGITNVFNMDSICFGGFGGADTITKFNPAFATNNPVVVFRNTNGTSRMSVMVLADGSGVMTNGSGNTKAPPVDFASNNGRVDAMVDRLFITRDRAGVYSSTTAQGTLAVGAGTFDVNNVILGYQEEGNEIAADYCQAQLIVSNTAVFKVNQNLTLGYSTATRGDTSLPGDTYGSITIGPGGTMIASNISVGGVTFNSGLVGSSDSQGKVNSITLTNGATLIVSNSIGSGAESGLPTSSTSVPGTVGAFNMYNSELVLNVDGHNTSPYVYVTALNTSGSTSNYLVISTIKNLTFPARIPLIYVYGTAPSPSAFTQVIAPSGYQGSLLVDANNANILDLNIIASIPKSIKWVGPAGSASGDWDTTTKNWLDLNTGLTTNFANGDFTTFDDSSSATNVNITSLVTLIPNNVTVTNNTKYYTFSSNSGGALNGGASLTKSGAGVLEMDATATLGVTVSQGSLVGSGSIGSATVGAGAVLAYSGTIGNGGVNCAGVGLNNGTINGPVSVFGGAFTNFNTVNGTFSAQSGGIFNNMGTIYYATGTSSVATNSTLVNSGTITGDVIAVSPGGTFEDLGGSSSLTLTSISMNGGVFIPGGDGIGTTAIGSSGIGAYPGALLLAQGSLTVFKVNEASPQTSTVVAADHLSLGGSASAQTQNGATLEITNLGTTAFSAGQYFQLFQNLYSAGAPPYGTGQSTNTYPVIIPATPGPGLTWDLSQLWVSGSVGVVSASSGPALSSSFITSPTNVVAQFSWSSAYLGYRLETEVSPNTVGINATNWTGIVGSTTNLSETITNVLSPTNCVFYRLVFP